MSTTRRDFLKTLGMASTAAVFGPALLKEGLSSAAASTGMEGSWKVTGSHWGAIKALIKNGTVEDVVPFDADDNPTNMIDGLRGLIYGPSRVRYPMVRLDWLKNRENADRTTRGDNRFVRVTWDEAIDLFYEELERVQNTYGPSGLYAGQTGWRQTGQVHSCGNHMFRGVGMHGNFVKKVGDYSTGAGQTILPYVLGSTEVYAQGTSWELILENSDNVIFWASDPAKNLQVGWNCETHEGQGWLKKLGGKIADGSINVISVDPVVSKTQVEIGCNHQYINPMSDVAFILALCHTLETEELVDRDFIKTYALGYDDFRDYFMGKTEEQIERTPEWASPICGVSPEKIRDFARMLAGGRTQLIFGWAIQRQQHGEQPYWAAAALATMLGQIGLPGGGISYAHHYSSIGVPSSGAATPGAFPGILDQGKEPTHNSDDFKGASKTIPVARWVDMLMDPGGQINANGAQITYPDVYMAVFSGCNPWHHHQDRNKMKKAFHKLETVVSVDFNWTATCRFSDIVLPACTQFERNDLDVYGSYSNRGIIAMHKLVDPVHESRTDFEIFTELTKRFGRSEEYTQGKDEEGWLREIYNNCIQ